MKLIYTLFCVFILFTSVLAQPKHEIRAVWLTANFGLDWPSIPVRTDSDIDQQKKDLCDILDKLQQSNFNVVFLQTRLRGDVAYSSTIEPWSSYIKKKSEKQNYDPLEYAIEACHERGMECHAWFVTYPVGKRKNLGKDGAKMTKKYGSEYFLDPGNPNTSKYLLLLVDEIVNKYDIDGFHFDYIRYPDQADGFPDLDTYKKYGSGKNLKDWRRDNINRFVYQAYDNIKAIKSWVQVSSSVVGMYEKVSPLNSYRTAYSGVYQDPADWLSKGKHDFIVPMMYYSDDLFFPFIKNWKEKSAGRWIVPGIGVYRLDANDKDWNSKIILDQIDYCREQGTNGNVYYRAQYLTENKKNILSDISTLYYKYPAALPPLVWLDSIPPSSPQVPEAVGTKPGIVRLSWEKPVEITEKVYYNVYCSSSEPVDISDAKNLLATHLNKNELYLTVDPDIIAGYFFVVTANDRYHNESKVSGSVYYCTGLFEK